MPLRGLSGRTTCSLHTPERQCEHALHGTFSCTAAWGAQRALRAVAHQSTPYKRLLLVSMLFEFACARATGTIDELHSAEFARLSDLGHRALSGGVGLVGCLTSARA